jgi:hypothetical protein
MPTFADEVERLNVESIGEIVDEIDAVRQRFPADLSPTSQQGEEERTNHAQSS